MKEGQKAQAKKQREPLPLCCFIVIMKYMDLGELMKSLMLVSRQVREQVITQNYLVFKQLIRHFNLGKRMKRADIPAKVNMIELVKRNVLVSANTKVDNLMPYCYFTDGGTYGNSYQYFIQNIFMKSGVCHSTAIPKNANIQAFLGRKVVVDHMSVDPGLHKPKASEPNVIRIPFEQYPTEEEEESVKQLKNLTIHNMGAGYTCFVSSFALFVSDEEIKVQKSQVLKKFENVNTVQLFENLKLPVRNQVDSKEEGIENRAFEIDLSSYKALQKALGVSKLDCLPILYVQSKPSRTEWNVEFLQRIACKYLVVKLIDSHKGSLSDNNIDMYNLTLNGVALQF